MDESSMTREEAVARAKEYSLQAEVIYCMDFLGYSPEEACDEWDL